MKEQEYTDLKYESPPSVPQWFWDEFNKLVPVSPNGKDRMLRIIWGMDRLEYCAGKWERRYGDTDHDPAEYVGRARWVIEGWQPADIFDEIEWKKDEHLLGEYPRAGVFDFIAFHTANDGSYLPLDESALNHVRIWAHWQGKGEKRSVEELLAAKHALWAKRHQEREERAAVVKTQFGEDVVKTLDNITNPVTTSGGYKETPSGLLIR